MVRSLLHPNAALTAALLFLMPFVAVAVATFGIGGCASIPSVPPSVIDESSRRSLPAGEVIGFRGGYGSHVWRGIPFALAPVDERRWRLPVPAPSWTGTREALEFGSPCAQLATPFAGVVDQEPGTYAGSEDCLYLNVYAPRFDPGAVPMESDRLPVMVWIHGGGNSVGHASFYDGGMLAKTEDVIVVTINYRLGPFGWFRHASLRDSAVDAAEASGNFGILDQIRALEWVRDNVSAFGGDPGNVTIFGESAGGRDVIALVLSPIATGLFHRAISQSGNAGKLPLEEAEAFAGDETRGHSNSSNEILARLLIGEGRADDRASAVTVIAAMSTTDIERFLRDAGSAALIEAYVTDEMEGIPDVPNVFGDGTVLPPEPPLERFSTLGAFNNVPIMFGTNRDETKIFMFANPKYSWQLFGFLPRLRDADAFNGTAAATSLAWKVIGADEPANAMRRAGATNVYVYRWDWDEEPSMLGSDLSEMIGAAHGFEIPFVFGHYDLGPRGNVVWTDQNQSARDRLSDQMMSYWVEFARNGSPGKGSLGNQPEWARWELAEGAPKFMLLDTEAGGGLRMSSEATTAADVVALVIGDPRLEGTRCDVAESTSEWLARIGEPPIQIDGCDLAAVAAR